MEVLSMLVMDASTHMSTCAPAAQHIQMYIH